MGRHGKRLTFACHGVVSNDSVVVGSEPVVAFLVFCHGVDAAQGHVFHVVFVEHHLVDASGICAYPHLVVERAIESKEIMVRHARLVCLVVVVVVQFTFRIVDDKQARVVGGYPHPAEIVFLNVAYDYV